MKRSHLVSLGPQWEKWVSLALAVITGAKEADLGLVRSMPKDGETRKLTGEKESGGCELHDVKMVQNVKVVVQIGY
jgi:hypothetical protein